MHGPHHGVGVLHNANPCGERCIGEAIAETGDGIDDDEGGKRWVSGEHSVCADVAKGSGDADAALAELGVDFRVEDSRSRVSDKRREKDEGDDGVVELIVFLEGGYESLRRKSGLRMQAVIGGKEPTPTAASFMPAMRKERKAKASRPTLPLGLFHRCWTDWAVAGGGTSLRSSSSSSEESLRLDASAILREISFKVLPGDLKLNSNDSGDAFCSCQSASY